MLPQVVVALDLVQPHSQRLLRGVRQFAMRRSGWELICLPPTDDDFSDWAARDRPDGIIGAIRAQPLPPLWRPMPPLVNLSGHALHRNEPAVLVDERLLAQLALDHLLERGFRHLAYCSLGQVGRNVFRRGRAFLRAVRRAQADRPTLSRHVYVNRPGRSRALNDWLMRLPLPLGVLAFNDSAARTLTSHCLRAGLRVPDDVAVVGVDNDEDICLLSQPTLTSIQNPGERVGYEAARLLEELLAEGLCDPPPRRFIPPQSVIVRSSSDGLALGDPDLARALRYIHDHAAEGITVDQVMQTQTCSRPTFEKRLKAATGLTPREAIQRRRHEHIRRLLLDTNLPLHEVARLTGYRNMSHFCTAFKRETGQTPTALRRAAQPG